MRARYEDLPPAQWTEEEAMHHLTGTFEMACREWPGIMEPYVVMMADASRETHKSLMRQALRDTIKQRFNA